MQRRVKRYRPRVDKKTTDYIAGDRKVGFWLNETNSNMVRIARLSTTEAVNVALDNYFTFNLTLYIIIHRVKKTFHIGYFQDHDPHDLHWHYIHSTGSGTVGDAIRNESLSHFKLEVIGKFSNIDHLIRTSRFYKRILSKKGKPYLAHREDDCVEVLIKNSKSIGKYNGNEKVKKV